MLGVEDQAGNEIEQGKGGASRRQIGKKSWVAAVHPITLDRPIYNTRTLSERYLSLE
ncbi:MAG: hypothetical protein ACI8W8_004323 [Rhodothermales bacterium]